MFGMKVTSRVFFVLLITFSLLNVTSLPAQALSSMLQFTADGYALGFAPQSMYAANGQRALRVDFIEANYVQPQTNADAGSDPELMPLNRVSYKNLWPGITLDYTARVGSIYMTTYTLSPGADVKAIRLRYNRPLVLDRDGALTISFETGSMTESAPIAWQEIDGKHVGVDVAFEVDEGQEVGFVLGAYNPHYSVIIDPVLTWTSFLGGSGNDSGRGIGLDGMGNIYVMGRSNASWGSPIQAYTAGSFFLAKLDASGNLLWNTFLGEALIAIPWLLIAVGMFM